MLKKNYFIVFFLLIPFILKGQLYIGKACIEDNSISSSTSQTTSCPENTHIFEISNFPNSVWNWRLESGSTLRNDRSPQFSFSRTGSFRVEVDVVDKNTGRIYQTFSKQVEVGNYPKQPQFDGKTSAKKSICGGSSIKLDPYKGIANGAPSNVSYKWFPNGETTPTIEVTEPGCYSVEVIDNVTGCSRSAKVEVEICYEDKPSDSSNEKWYFGYQSGIEFTLKSEPEKTAQDSTLNEGNLNQEAEIEEQELEIESNTTGNNEMNAPEAAAIVFNKGKKIVFYTDGKKVYNGDDDSEVVLDNGNPFTIVANVGTQGVALVPKPVCSSCDYSQYLLFTTDQNSGVLTYSVIDTRYSDQKGRVVEKDIPIGVNMAPKLTVERAADNKSYKIYAFDKDNLNFHTINIDSLGVSNHFYHNLYNNNTPPSAIQGNDVTSSGYVNVSQNQTRLAHGIQIDGKNFIELFEIDQLQNVLSSPLLIDIQEDYPSKIYGVSFSPNEKILYVTTHGTENKVLQFDLSSNNPTTISASKIIIAESSSDKFGAIAIGPKYEQASKRIYITIENKNYVPYLQAPNELGKNEVGFTYNSAIQGTNVGGTPKLGLPNVVAPESTNESSGLNATYVGNCFNAPTTLTAQKICDPFDNEFEWEVEGKKLKGESVNHTFSRVGWHDIKLTIKVYKQRIDINTGNPVGNIIVGVIDDLTHEHCATVDYKGRIYIKPSPEFNMPTPLYYCFEPEYIREYTPIIKGGGEPFTYIWMNGNEDPINGTGLGTPGIQFPGSGKHGLKIINNFGCEEKKMFDVEPGCEPIIKFPTVFTPNGDGENDKFKPMIGFIQKPHLEIYNRWGEMVFETDNLDEMWDGKVKGKVEPNQLYPYILKYFSEYFPERGEMKHHGTVLVLD